jgi:hypothetical protein
MPKASWVLPDGTSVQIEGTEEEVSRLLARLSDDSPEAGGVGGRKQRTTRRTAAQRKAPRKPKGPADYVRELVANDFFSTKRELNEVQAKLEEGAHIYPVTSLSPVMYRFVRNRELRRLKEAGRWKYVNP